MDFRLSPAEARFQREVHDWLVANLPAGWGTPEYRKPEEPAEKVQFARWWQGKLHLIEDAPVGVCQQCGHKFVLPDVAKVIDRMLAGELSPDHFVNVPAYRFRDMGPVA